MGDLDRALADIVAIRSQIAAGTAFQGYGPATVAATGGLAVVTTGAQWAWLSDNPDPLPFFGGWVAAASLSVLFVGGEMLARSRRRHFGLADALIANAVEQFLPAGASGALLAFVLFRVAPDELWILPGLWAVFVSLGLFASLRSLPKTVRWAAAWYLVAGLVAVLAAAHTRALSPWLMGLPFAIGQFLLAFLLYRASDDEPVDA